MDGESVTRTAWGSISWSGGGGIWRLGLFFFGSVDEWGMLPNGHLKWLISSVKSQKPDLHIVTCTKCLGREQKEHSGVAPEAHSLWHTPPKHLTQIDKSCLSSQLHILLRTVVFVETQSLFMCASNSWYFKEEVESFCMNVGIWIVTEPMSTYVSISVEDRRKSMCL